MERETLIKIVGAANLAPSGGNSQPWKFHIQSDSLVVTALPERDHPVFNHRLRGTFVAHGALLENIRVAASSFGYSVQFKHTFEPTLVTICAFTPADKTTDTETELADSIPNRHSNRRTYTGEALTLDELEYLTMAQATSTLSRLVVLTDRESIHTSAKALCNDAPLNFGNKTLHRLAFNEILFDKSDELNRHGLYVKTLEIPDNQVNGVKAMSKWWFAKVLKKIGMFKSLYAASVRKFQSSSAVGFIIVSNTDEAFLEAGRLLENVWLRATHLGLSMQIHAGIPFLWQHEILGADPVLSPSERNVVIKAYEELLKVSNTQNEELLAVAFRIGKALPPSAVSGKHPPIITSA